MLVGLVRSSQETSTRLDYLIDDMTGAPLEVRQFVDNDVMFLHMFLISFAFALLFVCLRRTWIRLVMVHWLI